MPIALALPDGKAANYGADVTRLTLTLMEGATRTEAGGATEADMTRRGTDLATRITFEEAAHPAPPGVDLAALAPAIASGAQA